MEITRFTCLKITIIIVLLGLTVYAQPNLSKKQIADVIQADVRKQIQELYSTKPEERVWAAIRLASMGEKAVPAIPFLIGLLGDTKIVKITVDRSTELDEVEYHSPADKAAEALGSIGKPAVEPLIVVINHEDERVRAYAALSLGYIKDASIIELLIAVLKDKEPSVRGFAALALGMIKDKRAVESLIAALDDKEKSVRKRVASALGELKDDRAIKPLGIVFKRDRSSDVRSQAAISLGKLNAVELLIDSLKSSDYSRRYDAVIALGETKDDRVLDMLTDSLKDKDVNMQIKAAEALGKSKNPRALGPLIEALNDNNRHVRWEIANALTEIGGRDAVETLIGILNDKKSDVRVKAAISLGKLKDSIALESLVAALNDLEGDDKSWAAEALGELRDPRAIEPLIGALKDKVGIVRIISAEALAKIGRPALGHLLFALEDKNPYIRLGSARALGEMKALDAIEPLINVALKDVDQSVQNYAALALWEIKDPLGLSVIVMPLTRALNDEYWVVRSRAAIALGEIKDPYGVEPLIDVMQNDKDPDVKKRAEIALEEITGKILGQDPEKWLKWWEENKDRFLNDT
jgi:HEAT repeat protein